jgi:hypothetical protein
VILQTHKVGSRRVFGRLANWSAEGNEDCEYQTGTEIVIDLLGRREICCLRSKKDV